MSRERAQRKEALAREREALDREKEALEKQAAISEILRAISSSPSDLQSVFDTIVRNFRALCGAAFAGVFTFDGKLVHDAGGLGFGPEQERARQAKYPVRVDDPSVVSARTIMARAPVHIDDTLTDPNYDPKRAATLGHRRIIGVPLLRDGVPLGAIVASWAEPGATPKRQEELLKTFADQAVIAIENVRLFNETKDALNRQTATADILRVIAGSPTEIQPVLTAVAERAAKLCEASNVHIRLIEGGRMPIVAQIGDIPVVPEAPAQLISARTAPGHAVLERKTIHIHDIEDPGVRARYSEAPFLRAGGTFRTLLVVPMIREGLAIGTISARRAEMRPFSDQQIKMVQMFADQAVIAIENVRLFNETKEALERQTATSDILKVISSSPTELQPVFDTILEKAMHLCEAHLGFLGLYDGQKYEHVAQRGSSDEYTKWLARGPFVPDPRTVLARALLEWKAIHTDDLKQTPGYREGVEATVKTVEAGGARTFLAVPMLKEGRAVGAILIYRPEVRPFTQKQIDLVSTFASQAVIAIENVRLFRELQTRNRDLTEALDQQTATGEILKVISGTHTDVQPVFDTIVKNAVRLCDGATGVLFRYDGKLLHVGAMFNHPAPIEAAFRAGYPMSADASTPSGRAIVERRPIVDADILESDYLEAVKERARTIGYRSNLTVPLMREGTVVGAIAVTRREPGLFPESYVTLLKTFADQAVIAIENVRLFNETKEALEQQKASADVLSVISASIADTTPVFETILDSCERLFEGHLVGITVVRPDGMIDRAAYRGPHEEDIRRMFPMPLSRDSASGNAILDAKVVHYPDIEAPGVPAGAVQRFRMAGTRAIICAPMLFEGQGVGAIWVGRNFAAAFTDKQIALLRTFADQAAIAIQNAKLFREIQEKSAQLEVASEHKSHFLASMSHELRTPLNAILGFNEMLLDQVYGELSEDVKTPLENMQASGKHLLRLINNVLDLAKIEAGRMELALTDYSVQDTVESVRSTLRPLAESKGLELLATVPQDLPLAYGDPGRITQCLMNLAGNSLKFTKEGRVEISVQQQNGQLRYRVADTGIGIPPDKIGSLFTEFKQTDATIASEYGGTGLGLSITKKFIEMHGGRIWVESEPGTGSTFTFELPLRAGEGVAA